MAVGLFINRSWRQTTATLRLSYAKPGFVAAGNGVNITDKTTGRLGEVAVLAGTRVGGIGPSGAIWVELGPALHLWDFGDLRVRPSALAGAAYRWAIMSKWTGSVRVEGMLSPSWFNAEDVPPDFVRRATWRYGVSLGVAYRL